ncbi:DUF3800 domain-containing protein [Aureimonas leprariae]|uniref:DUF3800 domain-containing protein n=1 Tax=Plantimonas leprariae TaxID=2615207 RepID=UPI003CCE1591
MTLELQSQEPYFLAYIDEAGDPGIRTVAPIDPKGASEWFVVGCTVMRATNEPKLVDLVRSIKVDIRSTQRPDLHFRYLMSREGWQFALRLRAQNYEILLLSQTKRICENTRTQQPKLSRCTRRTTFTIIASVSC